MDLASIQKAVSEAAPVAVQALPVVPGRTCHIDGDMLAYWAGGNEDMPASRARAILTNKVDAFRTMSGSEKAAIHLTADNSLKGDRVLVGKYWPYQGNRTKAKQKKPHHHGMLRQWMADSPHGWTVKTWHDREADDGFGWVSTSRPGDVIATRDKDMQMLPGWHIEWESYTMLHVPTDAWWMTHPTTGKIYGEAWFWLQMLQGDTADHIPGLLKHSAYPRGIGDKTAIKLLQGLTPDDARRKVQDLYAESWGSEWADYFVEQAILLWIRRSKAAHMDEVKYHIPIYMHTQQELADAFAKVVRRVQLTKEEANAIAAATQSLAD